MSTKTLFFNDVVFPTSDNLENFMNTMEQDQQRVKKITSSTTTTYQTSSSSMDDSSSLDNNGQLGPRSIMQDVSSDSNTFTIKLDVQQFKPEEVAVTTGEDTITIEGKHEEQRNGKSFVSRHFTRRYTLPKDVDMSKAECKFSAEGVLSLTAPKVRKRPMNILLCYRELLRAILV
jgi:HSP20 family molecular chaperone IbpA